MMLKELHSQMIQDIGTTGDYGVGVYRAHLKDLKELICPEDNDEMQADGVAAHLKRALAKRKSSDHYFLVIQSGVMGNDYIISLHLSEKAAVRREKYEIQKAYEWQEANGMSCDRIETP